MSARLLQGLMALALVVVLFSLTGSTQACCGETPDYFFTVSADFTAVCNQRSRAGSVTWEADYRLPANNSVFVHYYGDGVVQSTDYFPDLPHTPGAQVDSWSAGGTWNWSALPPAGTRKVRVEFWVDALEIGFEDRALIVFDCTARGAENFYVHNQ